MLNYQRVSLSLNQLDEVVFMAFLTSYFPLKNAYFMGVRPPLLRHIPSSGQEIVAEMQKSSGSMTEAGWFTKSSSSFHPDKTKPMSIYIYMYMYMYTELYVIIYMYIYVCMQ